MTSPGSDQVLFQKADAYERFMGRYSRPLAHEFARATGVAAGERVVDVGCGTGALTSVLAQLVGPDHVAAADPSEPFVDQCRANVPGADVRVGPAEALPFADRIFDRALAQLVFHFVADPAAAAGEMTRVTRHGGTVAACVWDFTGGMTMLRAYWDSAREVDPNAPDEIERFGGRPGQLAALWREVGLRDITDSSLAVSSRYNDFDELWQSFLGGAAGPVGAHVASLDEARREALRGALRLRLGSRGGPFELTARAWCAVGVV
jgi:ubiquinone/menaquinone biosynthesis C-methylase UbiE